MHAFLPPAPTLEKIGSSVTVTISFLLHGVRTHSQALAALLSTRVIDAGDRTASESVQAKSSSMKDAVSGPAVVTRAGDAFCCKDFCEALRPHGKHKKAYEGLILAFGIALTLLICSVPTIHYFSLSVSRNVEL